MQQKLTARELHKLALDGVYEVQPDHAEVWRDLKYGPLIVTMSLNGSSEEPGRYEFISTVAEARAAYAEIAKGRQGPALCAHAYICPHAILVEEE